MMIRSRTYLLFMSNQYACMISRLASYSPVSKLRYPKNAKQI